VSCDGFMLADHCVPEGAILLEGKYCERCGKYMFVESGFRYCDDCLPMFSTADESLFGTLFQEALEKAWASLCLSQKSHALTQ